MGAAVSFPYIYFFLLFRTFKNIGNIVSKSKFNFVSIIDPFMHLAFNNKGFLIHYINENNRFNRMYFNRMYYTLIS